MNFSLSVYQNLLSKLRKHYPTGPVKTYFETHPGKFIFLRHDVDRLHFRALKMAELENSLGVQSTYYFRCNDRMLFQKSYIQRIGALGHEIGFHYESPARASGNMERASDLFLQELKALREIAEVKTVAAHGSPLSPHNNKDLWKFLNPKEIGLHGDAYAHIDYTKVLYITDAGGMFGAKANLRDRVNGKSLTSTYTPDSLAEYILGTGPPLICLSVHPENWPESWLGSLQARSLQAAKNVVITAIGKTRHD